MIKLKRFKGDLQITHITGPLDGKTEIIHDGKLLVKDGIELALLTSNEKIFIEIPPEEPIYINNREMFGMTELRNNDTIRIDETSPILRVRLKDINKKTIEEVTTDAVTLAKQNKGNTSFLFIKYFFKQLFKYASTSGKIIISLCLIAVLFLSVSQLSSVYAQLEGLREERARMAAQTEELNDEIEQLEKQAASLTDFAPIIESYSGSVAYLDIHVTVSDEDDWITYGDLFDICTDASDYEYYDTYYDDLRDIDGEYYFDLTWSGSGFLIDKDGTILSNRHVMSIYENIAMELEYYGCEFEPNLLDEFEIDATVTALFPNDSDYYSIEDIRYHEEYDFAVGRIIDFDRRERAILPIAKENSNLHVGEAIVTMGYPSGIEFLVYKKTSNDSKSQELYDIIDSLTWSDDRSELFEYIIDEDLVNTHVTRGIISQVTDEAIAYDSTIYGGNSGGPIIAGDGKVHGIITWKWGSEETLNVGVSSEVVIAEMDNLVYDVM